jgi:hypothetical protein
MITARRWGIKASEQSDQRRMPDGKLATALPGRGLMASDERSYGDRQEVRPVSRIASPPALLSPPDIPF